MLKNSDFKILFTISHISLNLFLILSHQLIPIMIKASNKIFPLFLFFLFIYSYSFSQPLNGTYTIGGSSPNYVSFSTAAAALNTNGVSGPVIFNIAPGVYLEQITLDSIVGASSINTICFQSQGVDSTTVTLTFNANSNNDFLVYLNNCDHITFKGINFQPLNSTYKKAIYAYNGCSDIHIKNNLFSNAWISIYNIYNPSINNEFCNNHFSAAPGLEHIKTVSNFSFYSSGTKIENNVFDGTAKRSIYLLAEDSLIIRGNLLTGARTNNAVDLSYCGVSTLIEKNQITISSGYALYFNNCNSTSTNPIVVRNNMISASYNCLFFNYSSYFSIVNNTLEATGTTVYFSMNNNHFDLLNNIISSSGGSTCMYFSALGIFSTLTSDYNALYTSNNNKIQIDVIGYTLPSWNSTYSKDLNSITAQPIYLSPTNLHLDNCTSLNGEGLPTPLVTDDFDGQPRNSLSPDIGADEFDIDMSSFQDLAVIAPSSPNPATCIIENQLKAAIVNHSTFPITSFYLKYYLFNTLIYSNTVTTNLAAGDTLEVVVGSYDFNYNTGYNLTFEVTLPNNQLDDNPADNTYQFTYYQLNNLTIYDKEVNDCSTATELTIKSFPCSSIVWSTGETSRLITVPSPGTYSVIVTTDGGCILTDSITIN